MIKKSNIIRSVIENIARICSVNHRDRENRYTKSESTNQNIYNKETNNKNRQSQNATP